MLHDVWYGMRGLFVCLQHLSADWHAKEPILRWQLSSLGSVLNAQLPPPLPDRIAEPRFVIKPTGVPPSEMPMGVMPKEYMRAEALPIYPHAPTDPKSQHTKFDAKKAVSVYGEARAAPEGFCRGSAARPAALLLVAQPCSSSQSQLRCEGLKARRGARNRARVHKRKQREVVAYI